MKTILSLAVLIITLFILSTTSFALTITVTSNADAGAGSLRQAITVDAMAGDIIDFAIPGPAPHTIILTSQININKSMTINGPGPDMLTISGNNSNRIFVISGADDTTVLISGLKLINANSAIEGGAIRNARQLSIDSCVFENNRARNGGAIFNNIGRTITSITKSTFRGNRATGGEGGGAIFNDDRGTIGEIANSTFSGNRSINACSGGGAIFNDVGSIMGNGSD